MSGLTITAAERDFLVGLEELSRRTGVGIGGCGCCGSPNLETIDPGALPEAGYVTRSGSDVNWCQPGDYQWERGQRPVKADTPVTPKDFPA